MGVMGVTVCRLDGPVGFVSIGRFMSGPGWRHARRVIDTYELIVVRRGVLPMRVGERQVTIAAGQVALLPPGVEHAGTDGIVDDLDFYWMHCRLPATRIIGDDDTVPQDDRCLLLPDLRDAADVDRLIVLCGQLVDVYARFGPRPHAYCDYLATTLLLEVSAQERLRARFADHRMIAGYGEGGRLIAAADDGIGAAGEGLAPMLAIRAWITANACDGITVAQVARRFRYSPSHLTAMYRRVFGIGVNAQISECRIDRARELLSSTSTPVGEVAREVGYDDPKYFMRVFKRRTGLTPGQYRDAFPGRLYNTV